MGGKAFHAALPITVTVRHPTHSIPTAARGTPCECQCTATLHRTFLALFAVAHVVRPTYAAYTPNVIH